MRSYVSLLSRHVPTLFDRYGRQHKARHEHGIRTTLVEEGVATSKKLLHDLVMDVRGSALPVTRRMTDMNGALAWRALTVRYALFTAPRAQSVMSATLNAKS